MSERTIPLRELRNNISSVLREAEAGESFTVTVRGRPVARVVPLEEGYPRTDVPWDVAMRIFDTPVDPDFARDLRIIRGGSLRDPWPDE